MQVVAIQRHQQSPSLWIGLARCIGVCRGPIDHEHSPHNAETMGNVFSDEVPNWMMKLINISRTGLIIVTSVVCGPALPNRSIPLASCIP